MDLEAKLSTASIPLPAKYASQLISMSNINMNDNEELSLSSDDTDDDEILQENNSTLDLKRVQTNYKLHIQNSINSSINITEGASSAEDKGKITNKPTFAPTTIKSTSIGEISESEDDYHRMNHDIAAQMQLDKQCAAIRNDLNVNYIKHKWRKLLTKPLFCSRICALFLTFLLLAVSIMYCIAQLCEVQLNLLTECPERKTREEIWAHYEEVSLQSATPGKLTKETQHGYGSAGDNCWTTKEFQLNADALFYSNNYTHKWTTNWFDIKMILFAIISIYCVIISCYNIASIISDIVDINRNILHTKSRLYEYLLCHQSGTNSQQHNTTIQSKVAKESLLLNYFRKIRDWYDKYLAMDTTGWIISMFIHECMEIVLQSQALLMYNGYYILDKNHEKDVYLANKWEYIVVFACILSFNCFGSGICWLLYALAHNKCHGITFKLSLFFVDQFSDLFYTIFPFIILFTDTYNKNRDNILVLLGQLNVEYGLAFIAAFIPLLFLCNKCLFITINSVRKMRDQYYKQWKFIQDIVRQPNNELVVYQAKLRGLKTNKSFMNVIQQKEIYDASGNIMLDIKQVTDRSKVNWIDRDKKSLHSIMREIALVLISLCYIIWGVLILVYTIKYLNQSKDHCSYIQEDKYFYANGTWRDDRILNEKELHLIERNPELFAWDKCVYRVYPFTNNERIKCQCRVFVIDWISDFVSNANDRNKYLNISEHKVLDGILTNWIMMEKFKTSGTEDEWFGDTLIKSHMFKASKLKAFEWRHAQITAFEEGISGWRDLEYFRVEKTTTLESLPSDFKELSSLKYFRAEYSGLLEFPEQLCSLKQLFGIHLEWGPMLTIPKCVANLPNLQILILNGMVELHGFPISIFSLPQLRELSLWKASITLESILSFNNISINASNDSIEAYFDDNFHWNSNTDYYISLNSICDETKRDILPTKLQLFINETSACYYPCLPQEDGGFYSSFCPPNLYGDGRCDFTCNWDLCNYDDGDCVQMCFASSFSSCSWDLFTNQQCDEECNNKYCMGYKWGSTFNLHLANGRHKTIDGVYGEYTADNHYCIANQSLYNMNTFDITSNISCLDSFAHNDYITDKTNTRLTCKDWWIGDGLCDDSCRTDACQNDLTDCELNCVDDTCNLVYSIWNYLVPGTEDLVDSETFCEEYWSQAEVLFTIDESINCTEVVTNADYNLDKYINFREFTVIVLNVYAWSEGYSANGHWEFEKSPQVNCSSCVGMNRYNVKYAE